VSSFWADPLGQACDVTSRTYGAAAAREAVGCEGVLPIPDLLTSLAVLSPTVRAARWTAGVQAAGLNLNAGTHSGGPAAPGSSLAVGAHLGVEGDLNQALALRGTLAGNVGLNRLPEARLDLTLLHHDGVLYYGGGSGSGVVADFGDNGSGIPALVFSPLVLLNAHAVLGRDFGTVQVEGRLRLGIESAIEVRVNVPLR